VSKPRPDKVLDLPALLAARAAHRAAGRSVVWTNGCFDLLHAGHARSLRDAAGLGDVLVVGLNSDTSVRALKGRGRPLLPQAERAELLAALECVDHVLVFDGPTPVEVLAVLRPDVHCKGADYAPPGGKPIPELPLVEGYGGRVAFLPLVPHLSTTDLARRARGLEGLAHARP
jgi:rfaE bifunctional protein nucleotidyltransferase chain/domain